MVSCLFPHLSSNILLCSHSCPSSVGYLLCSHSCLSSVDSTQNPLIYDSSSAQLASRISPNKNYAPVFAVMMAFIQDKFHEEADRRDIPDTDSEVIMDGTMLFALLHVEIIKYMEVVLEIMIHYIYTLKLKKSLGHPRMFLVLI